MASYGRSSTAAAQATIWFTGAQIDYVAIKGTTTGKADIYLDGELKTTVDLDRRRAPAYQQDGLVQRHAPQHPAQREDRPQRRPAPAAST